MTKCFTAGNLHWKSTKNKQKVYMYTAIAAEALSSEQNGQKTKNLSL